MLENNKKNINNNFLDDINNCISTVLGDKEKVVSIKLTKEDERSKKENTHK